MEPTPHRTTPETQVRPDDAPAHAPETQPGGTAPDGLDTTPAEEAHHPSLLPARGIVLVVLMLALAGLYYWSAPRAEAPNAPAAAPAEVPPAPARDPLEEQLSVQDSSDDLSAIEKDLSQTDLDAVDQELSDIEAELEQALPQVN